MSLAKLLVSGADVWLNTPVPPMEASGTSGMKAALNGVPNLSVLDGWWSEACEDGVTGGRSARTAAPRRGTPKISTTSSKAPCCRCGRTTARAGYG